MKVLIIGNGGREHSIGIKIKQANPYFELFFAKGNAGTASIGTNLHLSSVTEILHFALDVKIDITIVGSEALLVEGIVDAFEENNLKILGPNKKVAQLEGDKAFAKSFMQKHGIRTASYKTFTNANVAIEYAKEQSFPLVIKATGLAAGKGVFIAQNFKEATETINQLIDEKIFGDAGSKIVIEEFLNGFEVSILSIFNKKDICPFISAKDHKKIFDGDQGPNTGGMGAIAPNPLYTSVIEKDFTENILNPTLKGIFEDDLIFSGIIFFGLMVVNNKCYLLEYNLRMGDPETQTILPLLNSNFIEIVENAIDSKPIELNWKNEFCCSVVLASKGYPNHYEIDEEILGIEKINPNHIIAGVNYQNEEYFTSGGRVLNIIGVGNTLEKAKKNAYSAVNKIHFEGMYYRKDIGKI